MRTSREGDSKALASRRPGVQKLYSLITIHRKIDATVHPEHRTSIPYTGTA